MIPFSQLDGAMSSAFDYQILLAGLTVAAAEAIVL